MEQIVVNLVINACDAMNAEGTIEVSVEVAAPMPAERRQFDLPAGPLALLTVSDDGPGMAPEVLARCLEPFFTTKDRGRGSGLGLPTVYGLVRERGGQLHIESEAGKGTRIRVWLPLCKDGSLSTDPDSDERWTPDRTISGRVLLVEDEADLRRMAVQTLVSIGLEVVDTGTGEEALEIFTAGPEFDVLASDVILPHMSGFQLAAEIRKIQPDLPVVYMTGYTGDGEMPDDAEDPIIRKPYSADTLRLRVAELIQVSRARSRLR
jgi:CheY-like chemotaxis protein